MKKLVFLLASLFLDFNCFAQSVQTIDALVQVKNERIEELEEEISRLKNLIDTSNAEVLTLEDENKKLNKEIKDYKEFEKSFINKKSELQKEIEELSYENNRLEKQVKKLKSNEIEESIELEVQSKEIEVLSKINKELKQEISAIEKDLRTQKYKNEAYINRIEELENENKSRLDTLGEDEKSTINKGITDDSDSEEVVAPLEPITKEDLLIIEIKEIANKLKNTTDFSFNNNNYQKLKNKLLSFNSTYTHTIIEHDELINDFNDIVNNIESTERLIGNALTASDIDDVKQKLSSFNYTSFSYIDSQLSALKGKLNRYEAALSSFSKRIALIDKTSSKDAQKKIANKFIDNYKEFSYLICLMQRKKMDFSAVVNIGDTCY